MLVTDFFKNKAALALALFAFFLLFLQELKKCKLNLPFLNVAVNLYPWHLICVASLGFAALFFGVGFLRKEENRWSEFFGDILYCFGLINIQLFTDI